jgi:single-stranded-DNA-specific exonuclease
VAPEDAATQQTLIASTGLSPLLCQLLVNRGLTDADQARAFLRPSLYDLEDPYRLYGMDRAIDRLLQAFNNQDTMTVYGDYDVDGVTGTALLLTFFRELGLDVPYYIPERSSEGYGLNVAAMHQLADHGVRLLITVDCGITAVEEVSVARRLGIDTIITDHHQPPDVLPDAYALLNPHQPACRYPNKHLCGVGVVFKLITALRAACRQANLFTDRLPNLKRHLDLVTLGTIADVTPIRDENRILVFHGLREIERTRKPGLQALRRVSQREGKPADAGEVGFHLAPRINATGRLGSASQSVALLTALDPREAQELAQALDRVNRERRDMQRAIEEAVHERMTRQYGSVPPAAIVLGDASWHHGIVGIVAARIAEKYHRPTLLLQIEDGVARGSGRSIPAFDLYQGLHHCAQWLLRYGGHKYAAGLTMHADQLPYLQEALIRYVDDVLHPSDLEPTLALDAVVPLSAISIDFVEQIAALAPYGAGNPMPVLGAYNVCIASTIRRLGAKGQHAKFQVQQEASKLEVIAFQQADHVQELAPEMPLDIAFTPLLNTWQGRYHVELQLHALRPHHPCSE